MLNTVDPDFYDDRVAPDGYYERYSREVPVGVEEIDHSERRRRAEHADDYTRTLFEAS